VRLTLPPFCIFSNPSTRQSKHLWTRRRRFPVVATSPVPRWLGSSVMYSAQQTNADNATINPAALSSPGKFNNSTSFLSRSHGLHKNSSTILSYHICVQVEYHLRSNSMMNPFAPHYAFRALLQDIQLRNRLRHSSPPSVNSLQDSIC
jgi:hypothetical protein